MRDFEFLTQNYFDTTTQLSGYNSGTVTVSDLRDVRPTYQYQTENEADDSVTSSLVYTFDETQTVERISLQGINWREFNIYYDGVTAQAFTLLNSDTNSSQWTGNSATAFMLEVQTQACLSITFDAKKTIVADSEKAAGYIYMGRELSSFDRNPRSKNYKPNFTPKEVEHKMSDGGTRLHYIDEKFDCQIKMLYISTGLRDSLKALKDLRASFFVSIFPTATGWDELFKEVVWPGAFDFYRLSDDAAGAGYSGTIRLKEKS